MEKNNNIEKFFRKRLESQEFSFHEEDWQKLEQRLDTEGIVAPKRINGFPGRTMFFAIVLLTGSFLLGWIARGLFSKGTNENPSYQTQTVIAVSDTEEHASNNTDAIDESYEVLKKNQDNDLKSVQADGSSFNNDEDKRSSDAKKETQPLVTSKPVTGFSGEISSKDNNQEKNSTNLSNEEGNTTSQFYISNKSTASTENPAEDKAYLSQYGEIIILPYLSPIDGNIDFNSLEIPGTLHASLFNFGENQSYLSNKMTFGERWLFGISLATDFNSIGMLHEKSLSAKIGGQFYFLITPNWWISAGIQYSNKKYNTSAEYYSPGSGYWQRRTNGVLPDNIFGTCSVFDIPVMLTYRFYHNTFISFTASAGVSNYLLQDEIYEFEFDQENPGAASGWQTAENSMAPFSFGNIYLGVEWQTSQRTHLVLEPFLQVPFKEVGWGNVKIYSTGIQAKIKYKIGNSR